MDLTTSAGTSNQTTNQTTGGSTSDRSTLIDTPGFHGSYDSQIGYRFSDSVNAATFGQGELQSDTTKSSSSASPLVLFATINSSTDDYLALYKNYVMVSTTKGSGTLSPKYTGAGGWQHTVKSPGSKRTRVDYFAYGPITPISTMPKTGTVHYMLLGNGNYATDSDLYFTSQDTDLAVNFDTGQVSASISQSGTNLYNQNSGGLQGFYLRGLINGNAVDGLVTANDPSINGRFHLIFAGPSAQELILTYVSQSGTQTSVGSAIGLLNPYQ